jgi:hypothetical protein
LYVWVQLTAKAEFRINNSSRSGHTQHSRVIVVQGTADKIVPAAHVRKLFMPYGDVPIFELKGQSHDPFAEGVCCVCTDCEESIKAIKL